MKEQSAFRRESVFRVVCTGISHSRQTNEERTPALTCISLTWSQIFPFGTLPTITTTRAHSGGVEDEHLHVEQPRLGAGSIGSATNSSMAPPRRSARLSALYLISLSPPNATVRRPTTTMKTSSRKTASLLNHQRNAYPKLSSHSDLPRRR